MVASEAAPLVKTGGLADVVGALPKALRELGHEVAVVLPRYSVISLDGARRVWERLPIHLGGNAFTCSLWEKHVNGTRFFFVDCPVLFARPGLYNSGGRDYTDNHLRFAAFCHGALAVLRYLFNADVIHLHDWQAALCAAYLRTRYALDPLLSRVKIVYTIHNLAYQGRFSAAQFADLGLDPWLMRPGSLEFYGDVNFMKAGILFSDAVTTVSPRYAREIQTPEFGEGLDGLLRAHAGKLTGILNGCDYDEWDPRNDAHIVRKFDPEHLDRKRDCKLDLLLSLGLEEQLLDRPLLGMVTRLAHQKGIDLFMEIAAELIRNDDICLAVVGSGDPAYEDFFRRLAVEFPGRVAGHIGYDNKLAHKIEAGCDMFLMPSRFEPCGLNQMYSLRYGTPPIVRATGGLDDTVDDSTGFKFSGYESRDFLAAIRLAIAEFRQDPAAWTARIRRGMALDYSWRASAAGYSELYGHLPGYNRL
jgi:starch synthase